MPGFSNDVVYFGGIDTRGVSPIANQMTTDGQLLIGSTAAPHIKVGTITAGAGISVTPGSGSITIASSGGSKVTTYDSSDTWHKDSRSTFIHVYGWGGGGGGAQGRQGASTTSGGGGGGAMAPFFHIYGPAAFFGSSESVTIGAGGTGGSGAGAGNGNPGGTSTTSKFGNVSLALGSVAAGGVNGTANGGAVNRYVTNFMNTTLGAGGNGSNTIGGAGSSTNIGGTAGFYCMATGAGAGGGADTVTARTGGAGAAITNQNASVTILAGGLPGIETGTIDGGPGNDHITSGGIITGGTGGGGGGGQKAGLVAGNGGKGGFPGGGGGGGGGSITGTTAGHGGDGGNGRVIVVEFF